MNSFHCTRCGAESLLEFPPSGRGIEVWAFAALGRGFVDEHRRCKPDPEAVAARRRYTTPGEWLASWDTGISSKTIWAVMTGRCSEGRFTPGVPHDPSDFGRCYRLLAAFPAWRARLPEVAARYPERGGLGAAGGESTVPYERDVATGGCDELFARLRALEDAARKAGPRP